ncbi:MAG: hypothetical protein FWG57_02330 [Endomicrobia bacterium]|nr:hypothetical protein [Endomicrobiia bacterium]
MTLAKLLAANRLKKHKTSADEISNLLKVAERDIKDAKIEALSDDRRYATAYNAVLQAGKIALLCSGYDTKGAGHHAAVFDAITDILGKKYEKTAIYFDSCRAKRNEVDYTGVFNVSSTEVAELIKEAETFKAEVKKWIEDNYPQYVSVNW